MTARTITSGKPKRFAVDALNDDQREYNWANSLRILAGKYKPYPEDLYHYAILNRDNEELYVSYKRSAAIAGYRQAQYEMGNYTEHGKYGVKMDLAEAINFYTMATMQGCLLSREELARIKCSENSGMHRDMGGGIGHYNYLARDHNVRSAQKALGFIFSDSKARGRQF